MIFSRREVELSPNYSEATTYEFGTVNPVWKATIACTDDVVMEISEQYPPTFAGTMDTEVELDKGTHSVAFVNEVHGIRFRSVAGNPKVTFRVYGPGKTN